MKTMINGIVKEIVTIPRHLNNLSYFLFAEIKMPITKRLKAIAVITNNRSNTVRLKISPNSLLYKLYLPKFLIKYTNFLL